MPRTMVIHKEVFKLEELDQSQQQRAHEHWREHALDHDWWEFVYADFESVCGLLGVQLDTSSVRLMGGGSRGKSKIYFSGFASQGDGACFEGSYSYTKGSVAAIMAERPDDVELNRIAVALFKTQRPFFFKLAATIKHRGHYYHSGCTSIDVQHSEDTYRPIRSAEDDIADELRSLMDWLYRQLEKEHDYQISFEQFKESCESNDYEFTEYGRLV